MRSISCFILFLFLQVLVSAHEIRPAYLSMTQTSDSSYELIWRVPDMGQTAPLIDLRFPQSWRITENNSRQISGRIIEYFRVSTQEKPGGSILYFDGLEKSLTDVLVEVQMMDGSRYSGLVKPAHPTYVIPSEPDQFGVIKTYLKLGIEHILFGIDHLLFVLALLLITKGLRRLVQTITAFTIAHSITLTMATLGVTGLPGPPVEAVIALSIVFLATELVHYMQGRSTYTVRHPWVVAFTFGLLHGFGFAGALTEIGLPQSAIPAALLFFNVGVELGQLLFILVVMGLIALVSRIRIPWPAWVKWVPPYAIGGIASFWLIERVIGFWG